MQYMGSKNRIAKELLPIILKYRKEGQWYIEPFVGGCNMIDKVSGQNKIGNDINENLISMFNALQNGWIPPTEISKEYYYEIKNNKENYPKELVCFVSFLCSFGVKEWNGYASNNSGRNYALKGYNSLMKQLPNIQDVKFTNVNYYELEIPKCSIIYCDPPYEGTTKYSNKFDHTKFWQWCRDKKIEGHSVFISEYNAPSDFKCIKEIEIKTLMDKNIGKSRIEKLFIYES